MNENESLELDDEIKRENGMIGGPVKAARWTLRATAAREVSWMQRNSVIEVDGMDILWKTCAFAVIHSEPPAEVASYVNDRHKFMTAVDSWMGKHNPTANDIKSLSSAMNERIEEWFAGYSNLVESGPSSGN
jgi:hypothetical protein